MLVDLEEPGGKYMGKSSSSSGKDVDQHQEQKIDQKIEFKASSDAPKCPLGHPTAALYFKKELNQETGSLEVSWKCALAAAIWTWLARSLGILGWCEGVPMVLLELRRVSSLSQREVMLGRFIIGRSIGDALIAESLDTLSAG